MANLKWTSTSLHPCPSCQALDGQVHSAEEWGRLRPKSDRLYCTHHCSCSLTETDAPEQGNISAAPMRGALGEAPMENEYTLSAKVTPTEEGFEILAITEGEAKGHGITFSRAVLQEAMSLYNDLPVFVDHAPPGSAQSVRNLAGTLHGSRWNDDAGGIQLSLKPAGPAKQVLVDLQAAAKSNAAIMQAVGFSSVVQVQLDSKRQVTKIHRVRSVDAVIEPARGGKFLSALHHAQKGELHMSNTNEEQAVTPSPAELELTQARAQLHAQSAALLDASLSASGLPKPAQKAVKKPFEKQLAEGKPVSIEDINAAIAEKRQELAEIGAPGSVQGPARASVSGMIDSADQFRLAVADLLGAEREAGEEGIKVHRPRGIQELYVLATGDTGLVGGYYPEFALVTANFPGIIANVMNKILLRAWDNLRPVYGWWEKIVTVEHFTTLNDVSWLKTGTIASLPTVAERGEYTELNIGDNKETSSWEKFGGYVPLTLEAVLRDDVGAFRRMPREVALAGMRNISEQVAEIFTSNSAAGPTLADGGALFNSTAVTTSGGHANLRTTAIGTDFTEWDAISSAVYNQPLLVKNDTGLYGTGKKMGIEPRYILVPRALKAQAEALFVPRWASTVEAAAAKGGPTYGGLVEPITVPEWTDANDFAAVVDPQLVPGIMIGEIFGVKPQVFSASSETDPAMFANDESRIKVRQFLNVGVADFRPLHKSNVT